MGKVLAMEGKKQAAQGGENKRREVKFNSSDLMELEFGRLLGEPHQETLAKVCTISSSFQHKYKHLHPVSGDDKDTGKQWKLVIAMHDKGDREYFCDPLSQGYNNLH